MKNTKRVAFGPLTSNAGDVAERKDAGFSFLGGKAPTFVLAAGMRRG